MSQLTRNTLIFKYTLGILFLINKNFYFTYPLYNIIICHTVLKSFLFFKQHKPIINLSIKKFSKTRYFKLKRKFNFFFKKLRFKQNIWKTIKKYSLNHRNFFKLKRRRYFKKIFYSFIKFEKLMLNTILNVKNSQKFLTFPLLQRTFVTKKLLILCLKYHFFFSSFANVKKQYKNFFFKINSHSIYELTRSTFWTRSAKNRICNLFLDGNKSPLIIMRKARENHLYLCKNKTIRNVRYKYFLKRAIKRVIGNVSQLFSLTYILRLYKFAYSWFQSLLIVKSGFFWINGAQVFSDLELIDGDVFQFTGYKGAILFTKIFKKRFSFIKKKIKKAGYIYAKSRHIRWMNRKRNSTRLLKWVNVFSVAMSSNLLFDLCSKSGTVLSSKNYHGYVPSFDLTTTSVMKMNAWKFRAR